MSTRSRLLTRGVLIVVILAALALAVQLTLAQSPEPEGGFGEAGPSAVDAGVYGGIPIQGRLTDADDRAYSGSRYITFSLYTNAVGGDPLCSDTNYVVLEDGLFSTYIGECAHVVNGQSLYLGIQVESEQEMTPRKAIYPVPYAFTLRPGAVISGARPGGALLHIETWDETGRGLRSYALAESGANYGVVGASKSPDGYGGFFYNNSEGGTGLYGQAGAETGGSYGVYGVSDSDLGAGVRGHSDSATGGLGVEGTNPTGTGVYGHSDDGTALWGITGNTNDCYGLYTPDNLFSLNYHTTGATMQAVQNSGDTALEQGDVVVFSGMGEPLEKGGEPVIQVEAATAANSTAVAGVVHSRYDVSAIGEPTGAPGNVTPEGPAEAGEYLLVVVRGPAQVKANAVSGALAPGDLVTSGGAAGVAAKAAMVELGGAEMAIPGTVLGKALEPLADGQGLIHIYVTLQ